MLQDPDNFRPIYNASNFLQISGRQPDRQEPISSKMMSDNHNHNPDRSILKNQVKQERRLALHSTSTPVGLVVLFIYLVVVPTARSTKLVIPSIQAMPIAPTRMERQLTTLASFFCLVIIMYVRLTYLSYVYNLFIFYLWNKYIALVNCIYT